MKHLLVPLVLCVASLIHPAAAVDFYSDTKLPADNPTVMHLFPEGSQLHGWISGLEDLEGQEVQVNAGEKTESITIGAGNQFQFEIGGEEAQTYTVSFGDLMHTLTVPPTKIGVPVAFFVVDRSVFRPNTELKFAAFLREADGEGNWQPLLRESVEIEITSMSKNITAAKFEVKPDDFGRVTGSYKFTKADALDDYRISVAGLGGSATVKVAEFRKAKVRLDITSEREEDQLTLKFRALDFLNKTVPASTLRFTARVVKRPEPAADLWGLKPNSYPGWEDRHEHWYTLTAEQQAMVRSGVAQPVGTSHSQPVHTISEEIEVGEDGTVEYSFGIDPTWLSDHLLEIDGVLVDSNNREQKASKSLPLGEGSDATLIVDAEFDEVPSGQAFEISARSSTSQPVTFVTFRLRSLPVQAQVSPNLMDNPFLSGAWDQSLRSQVNPHIDSRIFFPTQPNVRGRRNLYYPSPINYSSMITREFITLKPGKRGRDRGAKKERFREYTASLLLAKPGAYVVQAISHDDAGNEVRSEATVVVRPKDRTSGLYLSLVNDRLERGETLRGTVQSRWNDARVLLAVRDGNGIRALQAVTLEDGASDFVIELPEQLSLGCEITARYTNDGATMNLERQRFLVAPPTADLKITSKVPKTVEPGDEVELEFNVNREEEVDLIVSVYDQSLLGIAPERPVDGRSLFYADLRVEDGRAEALLQTYLGGLTPSSVMAELNELLKDKEVANSELGRYLAHSSSHIRSNRIDERTIRTLLAWRGAPIYFQSSNNYWQIQFETADRHLPLLDFIKRTSPSYQATLGFSFNGEHLLMQTNRVVNGVIQPLSYDPLFSSGLNLYGNGYGGVGAPYYFQRNTPSSRGDSHFSFGVTANASFSNLSGQAMISHLPLAAPAPLAAPDGIASTTIRRDFSDSAFFNSKVRTGADGKAKVKFKLPDSLTNWRVVVTAVTRDLQIARHTDSFKTFKPVMVWPMLSQGFTSGDRVKIFATVHNHTDEEQEFTVSTTVKNGELHDEATKKITVAGKSNGSVYFDFEAGRAGFTEILMAAKCAAGEDASLKRLPVMPCSAEQVITRSGFVSGSDNIRVPEGVDLAQARLEVTISPSLAGDMLDSLDYLIDYPHGCVEQTMSRFLPTIKVAQILERFDIEDPKLKKLVPEYSQAGIKRLLQLQKEDGGWGWNGNSGTHEMMTPYALFGLVEAQKAGFEIPNETAIPRGMDRLAGFINEMGDRQSADRIYCMWVFSQHGEMTEQWWSWLEQVVDRTVGTEKDMSKLLSDYAAALALEMAVEDGRKDLAARLARLLVHRAVRNGATVHWNSANFSRWGNDRFEITAAVLKAFAAYDPEHEIVPSILGFFVSTKRGKRWNSTKDTAMILYAMCDYLSTRDGPDVVGRSVTTMSVNGTQHDLVNPDWKPATLVIEGDLLKSGDNILKFLEGDGKHVYRVVFRYWREGEGVEPLNQGASVTRRFELIDESGKNLRALKSGDTVPRGSYIRSTLHGYLAEGRFDYTLSANPKLSCGEYTPLHDRQASTSHVLKESKAAGTFWHHEQGNRSIQNVSVYRAELAGEFLIAPAYVELMYDTEVRGHSGAFKLVVSD